MLFIRSGCQRGYADHGWLKSHHSFSFAGYHDPQWMGWGNLRVINEDRIAPGTGFGMHGHRDMEIISCVFSGRLAHQDSMGNGTVIAAGDVQRMSAGRGVQHSEFNPSTDAEVHLLQIWLTPQRLGIVPSYEQKSFAAADKQGRLCLLASPDGAEGSVSLHADARLYATVLDGAQSAQLNVAPGRKAWVQVVRGALHVNGLRLNAGDAAVLADEPRIDLGDAEAAEALVFDLASE